MTKTLSFAAVLALPLMLAAGATGAKAASPAAYCTFSTPASSVCPSDVAPPVRVAAARVTADHCVAVTPASTACPAGAPTVTVAAARPQRQLQVSRN